ncbi:MULTISPECIES: capsid assembly protein [Novosphingobium]|uniref:capsid assembly protein n=1 Tax=Novosphingobium TaxID=165696 RepID=UPI003342174D
MPTQEQAGLSEDLNAMMRDPRYLTDPAFRQQVMDKLMASFGSDGGPLGSVFKLSGSAPQ